MAKWTHSMILAAGLAAFFLPAKAETIDVPAVLQIDPDTIRGPAGEAGPPGPAGAQGPAGEPGAVPQEWKDQLDALEGRVQALEDWAGSAPVEPEPTPEPDPAPEPEPDPDPQDPPQTGELPEGVITPMDFGAVCDGVADDSAAVDAWLDELERRNVVGVDEFGGIPFGAHCTVENVRERNFKADPNVVQLGAVDGGSREIIWGIDSPTFTWVGTGKMVCDKPGGIGRTIAFIMAPQADYDSDGPTLDFSPSRTRDNEQITFDLAEWDGCQPLVLLNNHPVPVAYDPVKSQYSLKRLFFRGWVHDVQGGVILNTARYGDSSAMTIENGEIVAGAPAIEIHGKFENIDGRPCGKAGYCGRAIMIGSNREAPDTNGSVLISAHIDGVYGNDFHRNDGNEVQGIRLDNGHRAIIRDTLLAHVRHEGIHGDLNDGEQNRNQFNNYTNNTECLYDKYDDLWVINTTFRNCDGGGLDAHAWTAKSRGPVYGRNITFIWDHPSWTRWTCRGVRVPTGTGDYIGVTVEGYPECRPWATEGDPNRDEVHFFRTPGVGDEDERIFDLTFNGEQVN